MAKYNEFHEQIPDRTPIELPLGYNKPEPLQDMIRRMVRVESDLASRQGFDSLEEADDFECGDEFDSVESRYQTILMQEEYPNGTNVSEKKTESPVEEPAAEIVPEKVAQ